MPAEKNDSPFLVWVHSTPMAGLDAATWLIPTRELRRRGWRVLLIAEGPTGLQNYRGVEVFCISKPRIYLLRQVIFHLRALRAIIPLLNSVDIVLFHEISTLWILPLRLIRVLKRRPRPLYVMDTRTLSMIPEEKMTQKDRLRRLFYRLMNAWANHWADGRLSITSRMAQDLKIPEDKLWGVWPSGVDIEPFLPARTIRRWPAPEEPIHLIYLGYMGYERNLMALSRAVLKANQEGMNFRLFLVGSGPEQADLEAFAQASNGQVTLIHAVPYEQVPLWLAKAHVGVLPFPDEEKFRASSPIKLFEYMAAGLPIFATRIICHTDVIGEGGYVFWANTSDVEGLLETMGNIWRSKSILPKMGEQAATAAQDWTWEKSADKLEKALKSALIAHNHD